MYGHKVFDDLLQENLNKVFEGKFYYSTNDCRAIRQAFFKTCKEILKSKGELYITGICSLKIVDAKVGRRYMPRTNMVQYLPNRKKLRFRSSPIIKEEINASDGLGKDFRMKRFEEEFKDK